MNRIVAALVGVALVGLSGSALADDPTGIWKCTSTFHNQPIEVTLKLWVDTEGPILTGYYFDGLSNRGIPITPAVFKEENGLVGFSVARDVGGQRFTIKFSGTINGDTITGRSQYDGGGQTQTSNWVARRVK